MPNYEVGVGTDLNYTFLGPEAIQLGGILRSELDKTLDVDTLST